MRTTSEQLVGGKEGLPYLQHLVGGIAINTSNIAIRTADLAVRTINIVFSHHHDDMLRMGWV